MGRVRQVMRENVLGAMLGLAAGVLVDSCLLVLAHLLLIFIVPVLFLPPIFGILSGLGWARVGLMPRWPWSAIVLAGVFCMAFAALSPYVASVAELRWQGRAIPVPPNATLLETRTGPFGSSMAGPSVTKVIEVGSDAEAVLQFYRERLEASGWKEMGAGEERARFTKAGNHMFVTASKNPGRTRVEVTYNQDAVKAPLFILLGVIVVYLYVWRASREQTRK